MIGVDSRAIARLGLLERYRATGATTWVAATGRSMEPAIAPGSRLLVAFGRSPDRIGELVLFRRGETVVAHRLVARRRVAGEDRLFLKGDREALLDPPLSHADILGVVLDVHAPDGRRYRAAPAPTTSRVLARVSGWSGRAAGAGVRIARRVPPRLRRPAIAIALSLSRVPTRLITAMTPGSTGEIGQERS